MALLQRLEYFIHSNQRLVVCTHLRVYLTFAKCAFDCPAIKLQDPKEANICFAGSEGNVIGSVLSVTLIHSVC